LRTSHFDFVFAAAGLGQVVGDHVSAVLPNAFERLIAISGLMPDRPLITFVSV